MDWTDACWGQREQRGYSLIPISEKGKQFNAKFIVTDDVKVDAILGLDFLKENHCMIDCSKRVIT